MDRPTRILEDSSAHSNIACGGLKRFQKQQKKISNRTSDCFYDILAKHVAAFCNFLENLPETMGRSND